MKVGDRLDVQGGGLAESGAGTVVVADRTVFVADLAPGEQAEIEVHSVSRHHPRAYGHIVRRLGPPSDDRQEPPCPAYGRCGGCAWQHLRYPVQLVHKERRVREALRGLLDPDAIQPIAPAPTETHYRNKASYVLARGPQGVIVGGRVPRSAEVVDTRACQVVEPVIDEIAVLAGQCLEQLPVAVDDESRPAGALRYILVRSTADGRVAIGLVSYSGGNTAQIAELGRVLAAHDAVWTVNHFVNDETSGAVISDIPPTPLLGTGRFQEPCGPVSTSAGLESFIQVNRAQAAVLYRLITERARARGAQTAVDLYCGLGAIAFHLAAAGIETVGVDRSGDAESAQRAAEAAGLPVSFVRADAGDDADLGHPDLLVVNPPRKGLSRAARQQVIALEAARILYLSCGPASLARDLAELAGSGYRAIWAQPVDLMPGTAQVETLVELDKTEP